MEPAPGWMFHPGPVFHQHQYQRHIRTGMSAFSST
jgi:hypothetical protein